MRSGPYGTPYSALPAGVRARRNLRERRRRRFGSGPRFRPDGSDQSPGHGISLPDGDAPRAQDQRHEQRPRASTRLAVPDGGVTPANPSTSQRRKSSLTNGEEEDADDGAGHAPHAADDEHRDGDERHVEVERSGGERDEVVPVERAADAGDEARQHPRDRALDSRSARRPTSRPARSRGTPAAAARSATAGRRTPRR